ncbi:hypothetical protein EMWEY_00035260 [Eimeria maxima]|uniref:Transmembrane protein n=1 Tax=Eimeria maxima TaxID=5804 RepID=U6M9D0_EIMMA|nr:hypothetical protein EMWEY_00035260 [Eimeria maxima]CDJ60832.1 hypothetical protein EMWEY_00035260 [Eimeria maxima]
MCKQKLIKRPPAPALVQLLGRTTKAPISLSVLLLFVLVCRCSSSATSQHLDFLDEGFEVGEAQGVSAPEAAASATELGDGGDGGGRLRQVLNKGLGHVNMEWIHNAMKKFGWHAVGSAAAVLLLAVFVAARLFAAAVSKEQRVPKAPHEKEDDKAEVKKEKKGEDIPIRKDLKEGGDKERYEADEASLLGGGEKPAQESSHEAQQQQEDAEGHDDGEAEREEEEDESGGEEKDEKEKEISGEGIEQEEEATEEEEKEGTGETEEEGGDEKDQEGGGEETFDGESGAGHEGEGEAEMSTADDASQAGAGEKPSQESSQEAQQQQEDAEGHDEGEAEREEEEDESGGEGKDEKKEISGEGIEQEDGATEEEEKEGGKPGEQGIQVEKDGGLEMETDGGDEKDQDDGEGRNEIVAETVAAQLKLLQQLQRCVPPAGSLVESLNRPSCTMILEDIRKNIESAVRHKSAAMAGEPEAVVALAAANQEAERLALTLQKEAWRVVSSNVWRLTPRTNAAVVAGACTARMLFEKTGVTLSYYKAWEEAVRVCDIRILSLHEGAQTIEKVVPRIPSLQEKHQVPLLSRISAARVAVEASLSCVKGQEDAEKAAMQLKQIYLKLVKNIRLVEAELQAANLAVQGQIASVLLETARARLVDRSRSASAEEANLLGRWDQLHKEALEGLSAIKRQLEVLKGTTDLLVITFSAPPTARASTRVGSLLQELLNELSNFFSSQAFLGAKQLPSEPDMEGLLPSVNQLMDMPRILKPIVEAITATEQQVLEVGRQVEMQLPGLKNLSLLPQWFLGNIEKHLKHMLMNTKVQRQAVENCVTGMGQSAAINIWKSLGVLGDHISAITRHRKGVWELDAVVQMLVVLKEMVANTEKTKETALEVIGSSTILQPAEHQRARELTQHVDHAVTAARRAESLSAVIQAVGHCVYVNEKLSQLVWMSKLESLLQNDTAAAAEVSAAEGAKQKLESAAAEVAQDGGVKEEQAYVQAAVTKMGSNQGRDFGRQTTAKAEGETAHEKDEHGEDDHTNYTTPPESEGDEGSESVDEYEDATEWAGSS